MSKTKTDMPKVTQMLDACWSVTLYKNVLGSYTATATHDNKQLIERAHQRLLNGPSLRTLSPEALCIVAMSLDPNEITTDDVTPEQALTRLAYKVHGEILGSDETEGGAA